MAYYGDDSKYNAESSSEALDAQINVVKDEQKKIRLQHMLDEADAARELARSRGKAVRDPIITRSRSPGLSNPLYDAEKTARLDQMLSDADRLFKKHYNKDAIIRGGASVKSIEAADNGKPYRCSKNARGDFRYDAKEIREMAMKNGIKNWKSADLDILCKQMGIFNNINLAKYRTQPVSPSVPASPRIQAFAPSSPRIPVIPSPAGRYPPSPVFPSASVAPYAPPSPAFSSASPVVSSSSPSFASSSPLISSVYGSSMPSSVRSWDSLSLEERRAESMKYAPLGAQRALSEYQNPYRCANNMGGQEGRFYRHELEAIAKILGFSKEEYKDLDMKELCEKLGLYNKKTQAEWLEKSPNKVSKQRVAAKAGGTSGNTAYDDYANPFDLPNQGAGSMADRVQMGRITRSMARPSGQPGLFDSPV